MEYLARFNRLRTADPTAIRRFFSGPTIHHHRPLDAGPFRFVFNAIGFGTSEIGYVSSNHRSLTAYTSSAEHYLLEIPLGNSIRYRLTGRTLTSNSKQGSLLPPSVNVRALYQPGDQLMVRLGRRSVENALAKRRKELRDRHGALMIPISFMTAAGSAIRSLVILLARELDREVVLASSLIDEIEGALIRLVVGAQFNPLSHGREDDDEQAIRVVEDYVTASLREPIRLGDLCEATGMSARTLQLVFRRRLGTSPVEFVRARRLDAARQLLVDMPPGTPVSTVATECGFTHMGRFANYYRERFGELPSRTQVG